MSMMKRDDRISAKRESRVPEGSRTGIVMGVASGEKRGTSKTQVDYIELKTGYGVLEDGHAGTQKQVSLVAMEDIEYMNRAHGLHARVGDFAENIATQGIDLMSFSPGEEIQIGPAVLKVVCLGKSPEEMQHHTFSFNGYVLLPQRGLFCEVIKGGRVEPGNKISAKIATRNS